MKKGHDIKYLGCMVIYCNGGTENVECKNKVMNGRGGVMDSQSVSEQKEAEFKGGKVKLWY